MKGIKRFVIALAMLGAVLVLTGAGPAKQYYADVKNWAWLPEKTDMEVDLFFLAPSVYRGDAESLNMSRDDEECRKEFLGTANMERGIYEESCNLFAPYYAQAALAVYELPENEREPYFDLAYEDVREAFLYYMEELNGDRPVVLAGFSQGADMTLRLLEEFYGDSELQEKLVAAYIIGGVVTPETLKEYPHLVMAESAGDVGCIVSFNSEAETVQTSAVVPGVTVGINPLNWRTDSTIAEAAENPGACFTDYEGNIIEEIPELCGAYLDADRGTLKVTGIDAKDYPPELEMLESGVYHVYDYQFFYRSLQKNVALRTRQYLTLSFLKENYSTVESGEGTDAGVEMPAYLALAANVSPEMLNAQYWIKKIDEPNSILMTAQEIAVYNAMSDEPFYDYCTADAPKNLSGEELRLYLEDVGQPTNYWLDGKKPDQSYWDALLELRNIDAVADSNPLRFAIATGRADLRTLPTDDKMSTGEQFTFYDELQNSTTIYNEPLIVLHESRDGQWYFVLTRYCSGWIHREAAAICDSFAQWEEAQNFKDFLVVTDDKLTLEYDPVDIHSSERELSMGARLELVPASSFKSSAEGRFGMDCYTVKLPYTDEEGSYAFTYAYVPVSRGVHVGYVDYSPAQILTLAFNSDGGRYGWGGMYKARDCSQLAMELYRCFGLFIERNSNGQAAMPCHTLELDGMSDEMKTRMLAAVPAGSILHFPGHIMIYLGQVEGKSYVLSSAGSMTPADSTDGVTLTVESVMVNDLSVVRRNGNSWMKSLNRVKIIWEKAPELN